MTSVCGAVGKVTVAFHKVNKDQVNLIFQIRLTIFVNRDLVKSLTAIVDQLLTKCRTQPVRLTLLRDAAINVVLHILQEGFVGTIHDGNGTRGDVTIDSGKVFRSSNMGWMP